MAWNQPGSGNNPWGRRPNGSDLDTRVKAWQRKLESFFRRGSGGDGDGAGSGEGPSFGWFVAAALVVIWVLSGFFQVSSAEQGVIQRPREGQQGGKISAALAR